MLEGGIGLPVVASILGWSPATTVRMAKRYGHLGHVAQRQAAALLERLAVPSKPTSDAATDDANVTVNAAQTVN
jgi:hypothetical protein